MSCKQDCCRKYQKKGKPCKKGPLRELLRKREFKQIVALYKR
jgi:hypothetical protein